MGNLFGLVVDDDAQIRTLFAEALRKTGMHIVEAQSGNEAIAMAQSPDLAFVVTDVDMPDGDGWTLCRHLRASITTRRLPIVVVSGTPISQEEEATNAGCDAVLVKPCSPATLVATIRRLVDAPRGRSEPDRGQSQGT